VSPGLVARLKAPLPHRADLSETLAGGWGSLSAADLARRPVRLVGESRAAALGDLFDVRGEPAGRIRLEGDLTLADRLGAGLSEGEVVVEGSVGDEAGLAMAGGTLEIAGDTGARAGGAAPEARRGMTGGELVIRGSAGPEAGTRMRRGLLAIGRNCAEYVGQGMIAGTVVVFGDAGAYPMLWSKRGSLVAFGAVAVPLTFRYACTYQPMHLRLLLSRLSARFRLSVNDRHFAGFYRRYSGDMAELGKGEILEWVAT
jgi:formylmethanofuran dehydrogenase subunit C